MIKQYCTSKVFIMTWEEYIANELKYYDEHPEEDDSIIEAHACGMVMLEYEYADQDSSQSVH